MRTVVIAAVTAAVVALGFMYFWPKPPAPPDPAARLDGFQQQLADLEMAMARRPVDLQIVLTQSGARCRSQTQAHGYAYRQQPVRWSIVNTNCNLNGREIEIRFADDDTPLDVKRPKHQSFIRTKVRNDARVGTFKYALWAVGAAGDYLLEDPELEIAEF